MTHYEILGIAPNASLDQIRTAYRALAKQLHPDRLRHAAVDARRESEERLKSINAAYGILSDPARRAQYDATLGFAFSFVASQNDEPESSFENLADDQIILFERILQKLKDRRQTLEQTPQINEGDKRRHFYTATGLTGFGLILILSFGSTSIRAGLIAFLLTFLYEFLAIQSVTWASGLWPVRANVARQAYQTYLAVIFTWSVTAGIAIWLINQASFTAAPLVCFSAPLLAHFVLCSFIWPIASARIRRAAERAVLLKEQLDYDIRRFEYHLNRHRAQRQATGV